MIVAFLARQSEYINSSREVSYLLGESDCVREICNPGSLTMADRSSQIEIQCLECQRIIEQHSRKSKTKTCNTNRPELFSLKIVLRMIGVH